MSLPPVPEGLRALARKQLADPTLAPLHPNEVKLRTTRQWLHQLARLHKNMQTIMLDRQKMIHPLTQAHNENPGEWSRLLAEFDRSLQALRVAYQAYLDASPQVKEILATWRAKHNVAPDTLLCGDDIEAVLYLNPALEEAWAAVDNKALMEQWTLATTHYYQLLGAIPQWAKAA